MIISGFPCIGKSTLLSQQSSGLHFIDLESSCMFVDGERPENWIQIYINYAMDLNCQGFDVFVSSHKNVREELRKREVNFYSVYPGKDLKDAWIERLNKRYMAFPDEKNRRAIEYISAHFEESVDDMSNDPNPIEITSAKVPLIDFLKYKRILKM